MRNGWLASGRSSLLLSLAFILFFPISVAAQTWRWTLQDIDIEGVGTSIIADHDGNLHLSYYVPIGGQLRYAFLPAGSSNWYKMTLEGGLNSMDTGITVDSSGNPYICYTPASIRYAHWDGKKWSTQEVDPGSGRIAFICSIRVGADGRPMMAWYLESGTYLRFAILKDGAWFASSIDGGDSLPGKWNSMVLDSQGFPHISYSVWPVGELKYARFNGKNWLINLIDTPNLRKYDGGQRSMGNSLVLDPQGNPIISYYDEESLRVARLVDGRWKQEIVEKLPSFGTMWGWNSFRSTLVLDSKGHPHVGFQSKLGLEHAWWDGSEWHSQLLVSTIGAPHFENSMAIDQDDNLYIPFRDPADGSLRMAIGHPVRPSQTASQNDPAS
jgi:hypothetical protein